MSHKSLILCFVAAAAFLMAACTPKPSTTTESEQLPPMYPDYTDVWIPYNIAPLNFLLRGDYDAIEVKATCGNEALTLNKRGQEAIFDLDDWKNFMGKATGKEVKVVVSARHDGQWTTFRPFSWHVVSDAVDPYLTYRLIEPDYEIYQNLVIQERCVENFYERSISDYGLVGNRCMNCHTFSNQDPSLTMMYVRGEGGGAILNRNGHLSKLNIKSSDMASGSVYFGFSPTGRYITFSSNVIIPAFHAKPSKRLEVFDKVSDVYVADLDRNIILRSPLLNDSNAFETFPTFSPDGKYIYFCASPHVTLPIELRDMHYSLCRIAFDEKTGQLGNEVDTLLSGLKNQLSVCHPRISPDGQHIVYTVADYGTFPIWHQESDMQMMNLQTGAIDSMKVVNSGKSDTYHSWSSNSRWLVFASKRDDGLYGKPYYCYIDKSGKPHKPFVLPQKHPTFYDNNLKSFNVPEMGKGELPFTANDVRKTMEKEAVDFK